MRNRPHIDQKYYERDSRKGIIRILSTLTVFGGLTLVGIFSPEVFCVVTIPLAGFVMAGFYSGMHYLSHDSIFQNQKVNRAWGLVFSGLLLQNFSLYKFFHLKHHRFTGVDGDTEPAGEVKSLFHYLFYALNWDYFCAFVRMSTMSIFSYFPEFVSKDAQRKAVQHDAVVQFLCISLSLFATALFPIGMLKYYWLPLQFAMSLNFFLAFGEHFGCERSNNPFLNTRSFGRKPAIFKWFHWNANYHAEHHLFPRATPWSLEPIHNEFSSRFKFGSISYVKLNASIAGALIANGKIFKKPDFSTTADFFYPLNKTE